jgi:hypothetical protein
VQTKVEKGEMEARLFDDLFAAFSGRDFGKLTVGGEGVGWGT